MLLGLPLPVVPVLLHLAISVASSTAGNGRGDTNVLDRRAGCSPNCYYHASGSPTACTDLGGGSFQITGSGSSSGEQLCGKGWSIGSSSQVIQYSGTYQPNGNAWVAGYGWTRSPLVEYYIIESYGTLIPTAGAVKKGTVVCDGASYGIYSAMRYNQPSIDGTQTFQQFWSVRNQKKSFGSINGTVTTACHFDAWKQAGMILGTSFSYQILGVVSSYATINATITIL